MIFVHIFTMVRLICFQRALIRGLVARRASTNFFFRFGETSSEDLPWIFSSSRSSDECAKMRPDERTVGAPY